MRVRVRVRVGVGVRVGLRVGVRVRVRARVMRLSALARRAREAAHGEGARGARLHEDLG